MTPSTGFCTRDPGRSFFEAARYRACASRTAPTAWGSRLKGSSYERPRYISCAKPFLTGVSVKAIHMIREYKTRYAFLSKEICRVPLLIKEHPERRQVLLHGRR